MSNNPNNPNRPGDDDDEDSPPGRGGNGPPGQGGDADDEGQDNGPPGRGGNGPPGQGGRHPGRGPPADSPAWDNANGVPMRRRRELMDLPNVVGSGVGPSRSGDNRGEPSILVYVEQKVPEEDLDESEKIPEEIDGVPTDVIETGKFVAQAGGPGRYERQRPMPGGVSIGLEGSGSGSSSPLIHDDAGEPVLLSNRHVSAVENEDSTGQNILQPSGPDSSTDTAIGTVKELGAWTPGGESTTDSALIDVSTAAANGDVSTRMYGAGDLVGFESGAVGDRHINNGRTTGLTSAELMSYDTMVSVDYGDPAWTTITYTEVLAYTNLTDPGDSGSLSSRVDPSTGDCYAVGLHFAGSDAGNSSIAIPISAVENEHGPLSPVTDSQYSSIQPEITGVSAFFEATPIAQESASDGTFPILVSNTGGQEGTQTPTLTSGSTTLDQGAVTLTHGEFQILQFDVSSIATGEQSFTLSTDDQSESFTAYVAETTTTDPEPESPTTTQGSVQWASNTDWSSATDRSGVVSSTFGDRSGDTVQLGWDPNEPPLSTKAVSYYPMDEDTGPAVDVIGSESGTLNGPVTGAAGVNRSSAMTFDGVDDHLLIGNSSALSTSGSFSIAAIVRPTDLSPAAQTIYRNGATQGGVAFLSLRGNAVGFGFYSSDGTGRYKLDFHPNAFTAGERYLVAGTFSSTDTGGTTTVEHTVGPATPAGDMHSSPGWGLHFTANQSFDIGTATVHANRSGIFVAELHEYANGNSQGMVDSTEISISEGGVDTQVDLNLSGTSGEYLLCRDYGSGTDVNAVGVSLLRQPSYGGYAADSTDWITLHGSGHPDFGDSTNWFNYFGLQFLTEGAGDGSLRTWVGPENETETISGSFPGRAAGHNAYIGYQNEYGDRPFVGDIEEVAIFDEQLTSAEVTELHDALRSGSISLGSKVLTTEDTS